MQPAAQPPAAANPLAPVYRPQWSLPVARLGAGLHQMFGAVSGRTRSSCLAYPGTRPWAGAVGEHHGKFMVDQRVLRGGSCATPRAHICASYRNFFPTDARWQFNGLPLARDER